jgi:hypothetical protein
MCNYIHAIQLCQGSARMYNSVDVWDIKFPIDFG